MSLLRKSETKHVVTKTQKVSTPPKYLQSMSSSKGVRSTSYVHRTFVDAEAKVGKTDARFSGMTNPQLKTLLKALGVKKPTGNKEYMQNLIVEKLAPNVLKETLKDIKKSRLNAIYKFVSGKTFDYGDSTDEEIEAELTNLISLEINGRPKTKINNFVNQTPAATNTQQNKTKQDSGKTKEQIVEAMPGMPGAVGANPKADTIEKGRRKVKNNETFFTMKNGVTKLYKKISKNKSERLLPPDTTPPAPIAATKTTKTTKTTAKSQNETKSTEPTAQVVKKPPAPKAATNTTEGKTKTTEQTPEEKEAEKLDKKIDEFFDKLINSNKQSDQLSKVMRELNNRANPSKNETIIQKRLATLNDIITMKSGDSGDYKNGKRIGMLIAQLNGSPKQITYQEIGRALRNKNPKKGSQWSGVPNDKKFKILREVFSVLPEFKAGFKNFFEAMNTDNDEKVDVNEFATMYLRAKLKKAVFDETKIDDNFTQKTFDTMLKLFDIGEEDEEDEVETKTSGEFKKGDIVVNLSKTGIGVGQEGRKRQPDKEEAKKENAARQQKELARQQDSKVRADSEQEGAKQMAEAIENQKLERQAKQKEEEDEKKFIVKLTADGTFSVTQNTAYIDYKKKLDDIPKTACKPETTTNN